MSDTFNVRITATDSASPVFRSLAGEVKKTDSVLDGMGDGALKALQQIERNTGEAAAAMREFGKASQEAANGTKGFNQGAAAAGSAAASLVVGLGRLGQANLQQERQISAIGRLYGTQADEVLEFAEAIQKTTTFSNDAARQAALSTASLTQNYGFQADQIENLISLGADYASLYGLELTDATERLTAALRGEGEAAEALGLTLNDANVARYAASLGITNYSSGLDEAGRATVRYALLLEQSTAVEGYAAEMAGTRAGEVAQFVNRLQDLGQSAGDVLGPIGEVAAIAANYGPSFILASGAIGGFVGQLRTAAGAVNGFKIGSLAIGAAVGPIGLLAAGLGTVALGFAKAAENAQRADLAVAGVQNSIAQAFQAGLFPESVILDTSDQLSDAFNRAFSDLDSNGGFVNNDSLTGLAAGAVGTLYEAFVGDPRLVDLGNQVSRIINYGFTSGADNAGLVIDELYNLNSMFANQPDFTLDQYAAGITSLSGGLESFGLITEDANGKMVINVELLNQMTAATIEQASAQDMANASLANAVDQQDRYGISQRTTIEAQIAALRAGVPGVIAAGENSTPIFEEIDLLLGRLGELTSARDELAASLSETFRSDLFGDLPSIFGEIEDGFQTLIDDAALTTVQADAMSAAFDRLQSSGASNLEIAVGLIDTFGFAGTEAAGLAIGLYNAVGATNGVLGLYDAIDALGGVLSKASGIADALFGEGGDPFDGIGPLVDMLNNGTISQEQFNNATEAGIQIQADNVRGQEALNEVRANMLPLLADQTDELADYYERLAQGNDLEQQRALYLGDTANQQKLLSIQAAIYGESIGAIPTDVATQIVLDAANADPILKQFLIDTNQIEEDPITGVLSLNYQDGENATAVMSDLNSTLETLGSLIAEINGLPDPFAATASGAEAATLSTDGLTASTLALWEAMGAAPILPPINGPGTPDDPALDGTDLGSYGSGNGYPGATPPNIPPTPLPAPTTAPFPGYETGATNNATRYIEVEILAENAGAILQGIEGQVRILDENGAEVLVTADDAQALDALAHTDGQIQIIDGATGTVYVLGDDGEATSAVARATGALKGADGQTALLFANGDSSGAEAAASAAGAAIFGVDGTTGFVYVSGIDNYSGMVANAGALAGRVLATTYVDTVYRDYKQSFSFGGKANGGVLGYADGGVLPTAALGRVLVGENGPEIATLPGGTLITPSPASQAIARQMRGGDGGQSLVFNNYGSINGIEDLAGFIYDGLAQAAAMEAASQGGR